MRSGTRTAARGRAGWRPAAVDPWSLMQRLPIAVAGACCLVLLLSAAKALAVWRSGTFFNPDDAMRAVEVRDLLAGQGWYDLVQHRLAPAHPFAMHWSRLADLPLAGAMLVLERLTEADTAERLTRLLQPVACLVVFMIALARLGRDLIGPRGVPAATLLAAGGIETMGAFLPGHIHHHALQIALLMVFAGLVAAGVAQPAGRAARFAWAGGLAALSLAINLQNLPFVLVGAAALGIGWIARGEAFGPAMRGFALALMAGGALVFLLQVAPGQYGQGTCDAFGAPHLLAAGLGGAALLALAGLDGRLKRAGGRLAAAVLAGGSVALALKLTYPACLGDPYVAVDPLLRTGWLAEVGEAMPLTVHLRRDPIGAAPVALALAFGLTGILAAAWHASGSRRAQWLVIAGFAATGLAGALWEMRMAASAEGFAALGGAWALCRWFDPSRPRKPLAPVLCVLSGLAFTQAGWAAVVPVLTGVARPAAPGPRIDPQACADPGAYAGLAALPAGLVLSTIDPGPMVLAYTHHSVLAAPYHRNAFGNRLALLAFPGTPDEARPLVLASRADYVMICLTSPEIQDFAAAHPDGLAARLLAGEAPDWLRPVAEGTGVLRVFQVASGRRAGG